MEQHVLTGKFVGQYRKNSTLVFRYALSGKDEGIEAYKALKGDNYRQTEDGDALYFTTRFAGNTCKIVVNAETEKIYVDDSAMAQASSLASQFAGTPLGDAMAQQLAASLLKGVMGVRTQVSEQPTPQRDGKGADLNS